MTFLRANVAAIVEAPNIVHAPMPKRWGYWLVAAGIVLFVGAGSWFFFVRNPTAELPKRMVVVSEATNVPGDHAFAGAFHTQLALQLERSSKLRALTDGRRVRETLRYMRKAAEATVTPELARDVCERVAGAALIEGSIAKVGEQ